VFPQAKIQCIRLRGLCRPVDWVSASYPRFTETVQLLSDSADKNLAGTTCVVEEEAHVSRVLVNHSLESDGALHLLVCLVRQLVLELIT
jgi:hypothetical protein